MTVQDATFIIEKLLHEPHAGLLSGIAFGMKATLNKNLYDALIRTGTIHIAALSGMNISILISLVNLTLLPVLGRRLSSVLTILIIIGFIWFVGPSASVIRAGIMGSLALGAIILGRQAWTLYAYMVTVIVMLVVYPLWIADVSFQLSALATLGLILFGPSGRSAQPQKSNLARSSNPNEHIENNDTVEKTIHASFFKRCCAWAWILVKEDLHLTLAAQSLTIPVILFTFHRLSLIAPLTNVLIGWTMAPITILGLVTAFLGYIWLPLGYLPSWVCWVFLEYVIRVVSFTAAIPFASIGW